MSDRGTTNSNTRGNSKGRRMRRLWLLNEWGDGVQAPCFYCGQWLRDGTITVDRIIPGHLGGRYVYGNIRPACLHCNSIEGSKMRDLVKANVDFFGRTWPTTLHPHLAPRRSLLPGQATSILHLVGDGRMSRARIAREVGCHADTVTYYATR